MNGSLDGPVFETIAGRGPDLCLREHCPLHGLWAIAMISNALLHEDFLVVVRRSLSQQHTLRYWERGYREYCPEEMELTKAHGPGLGDRPQVLMTITTSRHSFPVHAAALTCLRQSLSGRRIDHPLMLGAVVREKIN